jgi:hypothetical protein
MTDGDDDQMQAALVQAGDGVTELAGQPAAPCWTISTRR